MPLDQAKKDIIDSTISNYFKLIYSLDSVRKSMVMLRYIESGDYLYEESKLQLKRIIDDRDSGSISESMDEDMKILFRIIALDKLKNKEIIQQLREEGILKIFWDIASDKAVLTNEDAAVVYELLKFKESLSTMEADSLGYIQKQITLQLELYQLEIEVASKIKIASPRNLFDFSREGKSLEDFNKSANLIRFMCRGQILDKLLNLDSIEEFISLRDKVIRLVALRIESDSDITEILDSINYGNFFLELNVLEEAVTNENLRNLLELFPEQIKVIAEMGEEVRSILINQIEEREAEYSQGEQFMSQLFLALENEWVKDFINKHPDQLVRLIDAIKENLSRDEVDTLPVDQLFLALESEWVKDFINKHPDQLISFVRLDLDESNFAQLNEIVKIISSRKLYNGTIQTEGNLIYKLLLEQPNSIYDSIKMLIDPYRFEIIKKTLAVFKAPVPSYYYENVLSYLIYANKDNLEQFIRESIIKSSGYAIINILPESVIESFKDVIGESMLNNRENFFWIISVLPENKVQLFKDVLFELIKEPFNFFLQLTRMPDDKFSLIIPMINEIIDLPELSSFRSDILADAAKSVTYSYQRFFSHPLEVIKWLISQGMDVNKEFPEDGYFPLLHSALMYAHPHPKLKEIIKVLIEANADINKYAFNFPPHIAPIQALFNNSHFVEKDFLDFTKLLLDYGVKLDAKDRNGRTFSEYAIGRLNFKKPGMYHNELLDLLQSHRTITVMTVMVDTFRDDPMFAKSVNLEGSVDKGMVRYIRDKFPDAVISRFLLTDKGKELLTKAFSIYGQEKYNQLLEIGKDKEIAEQILESIEAQGIEKTLDIFFGAILEKIILVESPESVVSKFLLTKNAEELLAKASSIYGQEAYRKMLELLKDEEMAEQILESIVDQGVEKTLDAFFGVNLEEIAEYLVKITKDEGGDLDGLNQIISAAHGNNKSAQKFITTIHSLRCHLDKLLDQAFLFGKLLGQAVFGNEITKTLLLLEGYLEAAASGMPTNIVMPSPGSGPGDNDGGSGGSVGGGYITNSTETHIPTEDMILYIGINSTDNFHDI